MVDGWNWKIDKYIVVIDKITLWTGTRTERLSDQSAAHGSPVAQVDGPFVVDLHKGGPLDGKGGGGEQALAIAAIANQNDNGGARSIRRPRTRSASARSARLATAARST